jgi:3-hydroxyacyl-[acyl-carrier-protein] dehydratase
VLDSAEIRKLLPHREPMLLLERVWGLEPGCRAWGERLISADELFLRGHFPGRPILPGVVIAEAMAQLAGVVAISAHTELAGRDVLLLGMDHLRFRRPVVPGDRLDLYCERKAVRLGIWRFAVLAEVGGDRVADGEILATMADRPNR